MSLKHNPFPPIVQFKDIIREMRHKVQVRFDPVTQQEIVDRAAKLPVVVAYGTVKLHGTNAGVSWSRATGLYVQSRNQVFPVDAGGHFGFTNWVRDNSDYFVDQFKNLAKAYNVQDETITIFGEWAGKGIQKGVAVAQLDTKFFPFEVKIKDFESDHSRYVGVLDYVQSNNELGIHRITDFPMWKVEVDFNDPQAVQNKLVEITEQVEAECPVGKAFGVSGVGEGVVYRIKHNNTVYRWKVKGEKHSVSKVKTLAAVDEEKLASIKEFVNYAVTEQRVKQAIAETEATEFAHVGNVIRWTMQDILKEETGALESNGIEWKEAAKSVASKTKDLFSEMI